MTILLLTNTQVLYGDSHFWPLAKDNKAATRTGRIHNAQGSCCRCFLPDLTGFTGLHRVGPSPGDTGYPYGLDRWKTGLREGLFGLSALTPSGPPSLRSGVQTGCADLSNPTRLLIPLSSVFNWQSSVYCLLMTVNCLLFLAEREGLFGLSALTPSGPPSLRSGVQIRLRRICRTRRGFSYLSLLSSIVSLQFTVC